MNDRHFKTFCIYTLNYRFLVDSPPLVYGIQCHSGQAYPGVTLAVHRLQNVHSVPGLRRPGKLPRKSAREIHADLLILHQKHAKRLWMFV